MPSTRSPSPSIASTGIPIRGRRSCCADRGILLNCSRQAGKSTATAVIALHTALYKPSALVLLVSPTDRQSKNLFNKVVDFLRRIKEKPSLKEDNIHSMTFESGSRIFSLPGNNPANIRGYSAPALVVLDEAAYINDALYTALRPMLAVSGGRFIMLSTPNGRRGCFYDA
jgi:phage terminase large subunit-like protein